MGEQAQALLQKVRRGPKGNSRDRIYLWNQRSKADQRAIWQACSDGGDGFLLWLRAFAFTYDPRLERKHISFIPYPVQDAYALALHDAIAGGEDILADKTRDMGALWLCVYALAWWWLFVPDTPLLMASRKESYVDDPGNPDCLFWKVDYTLSHLPPWMQPPVRKGKHRTHMHLLNPWNGSVIDGETTNTDLGRGGRRKAILLDEFASVDNGSEIDTATADTTPCRIFNSTPKGRANAFANIRFSGKVKVVTLHWSQHPVKAKGLYYETLPDGSKKARSPWYDAECERRVSRKAIAQELDCDYLASGDTFFDLDILQRVRASGSLREAVAQGEVSFRVRTREAGETYKVEVLKWVPDGGRQRLKLWCPLSLDPNYGWERPNQGHNFVAFADISYGQGESNSILDVFDCNTSEQVAQFCCADTPPHEFAHVAVAIAKWFGGACGWTFLGWESNSPGLTFGQEVLRAQYPYIYHQRNEKIEGRPRSKNFGWSSTRDRKIELFGDLRRAVGRGEVVLHERQTVAEMEQVVLGPSGEPIQATMSEENAGARAAHGDRVVAAAGCVMLLHEQPKARPPEKEPPPQSFAWRRKQDRDRRKPAKNIW